MGCGLDVERLVCWHSELGVWGMGMGIYFTSFMLGGVLDGFGKVKKEEPDS